MGRINLTRPQIHKRNKNLTKINVANILMIDQWKNPNRESLKR